MTTASPPGLLTLHAVRLLGFADTPAVAARFALDPASVHEALLDAQAAGQVTRSGFADLHGWSLTDRGRAHGQAQLADELDRAGARGVVDAVHDAFLPLNARLRQACTAWQLRPTATDPLAANDHTDAAWDARVLADLDAVGRGLVPLAARLTSVLARFGGYDERFATALRHVRAGRPGWVDGIDVDSCHRVWFELHEDLVATLGVDRSAHA